MTLGILFLFQKEENKDMDTVKVEINTLQKFNQIMKKYRQSIQQEVDKMMIGSNAEQVMEAEVVQEGNEAESKQEVIQLPEMEWALFLETEVSHGANADTYYRYGIYGDFTKERNEGEEIYFSLHGEIIENAPKLQSEVEHNKEHKEFENHKEWIRCKDELIVGCSPDMEWIVTRKYTNMNGHSYIECWYENGKKVKEFKGDVANDIKIFVPYKKEEETSWSVLEEKMIIGVGTYMSNFYNMSYCEYNRGLCCYSAAGKMLAAANKSISKEPNGIDIYLLNDEEIVLLYELAVPTSEGKWPIQISQLEGDKNNGWVVYSYGYETFRMTYPEGKIEKLGEYMFSSSYSPDGKYLVYCTGNRDLDSHWENLSEAEYEDYYKPMKEEWNKIPQGWYVIDLETGEKSYIPIPVWTYDADRPLYGGRCTWIEKDKLMELLEK